MVRPGTRNAVCRIRSTRPSSPIVASLRKIWRSGQKRTRVPVMRLAHPFALLRPRAGGLLGELRVGPVAGELAGDAARLKLITCGVPVAVDLDVEAHGQGVDHRGADAVQAAGGGVGAAAELAARVQPGHHQLDAGQPGLGLDVDRDAAAVVADLDRAVGVQDHARCAMQYPPSASSTALSMISQRQCMQTAAVGRPDVHSGPLAHGLQALEHRQVLGAVGVGGVGRLRGVRPRPWPGLGVSRRPDGFRQRCHGRPASSRTFKRHALAATHSKGSVPRRLPGCHHAGLPRLSWLARRIDYSIGLCRRLRNHERTLPEPGA